MAQVTLAHGPEHDTGSNTDTLFSSTVYSLLLNAICIDTTQKQKRRAQLEKKKAAANKGDEESEARQQQRTAVVERIGCGEKTYELSCCWL